MHAGCRWKANSKSANGQGVRHDAGRELHRPQVGRTGMANSRDNKRTESGYFSRKSPAGLALTHDRRAASSKRRDHLPMLGEWRIGQSLYAAGPCCGMIKPMLPAYSACHRFRRREDSVRLCFRLGCGSSDLFSPPPVQPNRRLNYPGSNEKPYRHLAFGFMLCVALFGIQG